MGMGGDPRTDHASLSVEKGGDPRTDHAIFGEAYGVEKGGDPKTDHASLGVVAHSGMAATCPPYRPGELASQTAKSYPSTVCPDCSDSAVFHVEFQEPPDGFPSTAEDLDGLQCSAEMKGCELAEGRILDSLPDCKSAAFTRISRVAEKSEEILQSDFRVQNSSVAESAEGMSSEHCGGSQSQSTGFGNSIMLGTEASEFLSISDRALLRRFGMQETMGRLIRGNPSNVQLLGGGRRAGTQRSRVRSIQKFIGWLIAAHGNSFPNHWRQLTEYLQVRYSEPCVRGALKLVHSSFVFLQEVAGIDKLTDTAMYSVSLKELMAQASPGKAPRQAPRFPTFLLAALEDMVLSLETPLFMSPRCCHPRLGLCPAQELAFDWMGTF